MPTGLNRALSFLGRIAGLAVVALVSRTIAGDDLFAAHPVWQIEIELASQSLEGLRTESRKYVRANIRTLGETLQDAGIHLKGIGSFRPLDDKPSFTVDFGRFVRGQTLRGLQKIHLNNSVQDASYLREKLAAGLFQDALIPVPHTAHALVRLNGRPLGLYVLKEGFSQEFLSRSFDREGGDLYEAVDGQDVDQPMKRNLGSPSAEDQIELKRLAVAAQESDLRRRWEQLQQRLDMDRFFAFMSMELMICHWDGYCLGQNNFRIYHDPLTDRIVFLPSGMDQVFSKADMPWRPHMAGLVARAVMEVPEGRQQYAVKFRDLFSTMFVSERLAHRVNQFLDDLRPWLSSGEFRRIRREAADLCIHIAERERSLRAQLSEPEPAFPQFDREVAFLSGWKAFDEPQGGTMLDGQSLERKAALRIVAGGKTMASWRTTVKLKPGRYQFRGQAKVIGVTPLSFGASHGASLRIAGKPRRSAELVATSGWEELKTEFEVGVPEEDIVLICQLRAAAGEAWFDKASLSLVRQR